MPDEKPIDYSAVWKILAIAVPMVSVVGTYSALWISFLNRLAIVEAKLAERDRVQCNVVYRQEKTGKP